MLNLEEFIQQALDPRELKRGIAVKLHLQGSTYKEGADVVQMTDSFVKKWCIAYHKKGSEALRLGYKGSRGYLKASERQEIIIWIQERNYWDIEELREHIELTYQVNYKDEESYYDLLKAAGLSWKKSQKSKASSWMAANHCAIGTWLTAARRREGLGCDRFGIGVVESFF